MCVLWIKVHRRKKSGNLFNDPCIYIYIYRYFSRTWLILKLIFLNHRWDPNSYCHPDQRGPGRNGKYVIRTPQGFRTGASPPDIVSCSTQDIWAQDELVYIYIYIYIYICMYVVHSISFQFFSQAFKIVIDSWKFNMLLLYIFWDDWPIFMISGSNESKYHMIFSD